MSELNIHKSSIRTKLHSYIKRLKQRKLMTPEQFTSGPGGQQMNGPEEEEEEWITLVNKNYHFWRGAKFLELAKDVMGAKEHRQLVQTLKEFDRNGDRSRATKKVLSLLEGFPALKMTWSNLATGEKHDTATINLVSESEDDDQGDELSICASYPLVLKRALDHVNVGSVDQRVVFYSGTEQPVQKKPKRIEFPSYEHSI
jgi:hypothetical protein